jgi:hypothetical protein
MTEYFDSIRKTVLERVTSPLSGTFIAAWAIHNWKVFFIAFGGDLPPGLRVHIINENYFTLVDFLLWPLLYAFIVLALYPILALGATHLWEWSKPKRKSIILKYEDQIPITQNEYKKMKLDFERETSDMQSRLNAKDIRIKGLMEEVEGFKSQLAEIEKEYNEKTINVGSPSRSPRTVNGQKKLVKVNPDYFFSPDESKLISTIFSGDSISILEKDLRPTLKLSPNETSLLVQKLMKNGFIEKTDNFLKLSYKGLETASEMKKMNEIKKAESAKTGKSSGGKST